MFHHSYPNYAVLYDSEDTLVDSSRRKETHKFTVPDRDQIYCKTDQSLVSRGSIPNRCFFRQYFVGYDGDLGQ